MSDSDPYQLIVDGKYQDAIEVYSRLFERTKEAPHSRNRATAQLCLDDASGALASIKAAQALQEPRFRGDHDNAWEGVCHWYLDRPAAAVAAWQAGLDAPYTDAAGGVELPALLVYAAVRLGDEALARQAEGVLDERVREQPRAWPGPLAPFLLGAMSESALDAHAEALSMGNPTLAMPGRLLCRRPGVAGGRLGDLPGTDGTLRCEPHGAAAPRVLSGTLGGAAWLSNSSVPTQSAGRGCVSG
jgi:hypothetical protein